MKVGIDDLISRFDGVRRLRAGSWAAKCSVHDDRHGSLVISEGDLRLVCFCHAGCDEQSVLGMVGVDKRDLYYKDEIERPDGTVNIAGVDATPPAMPAMSRPRTVTAGPNMPTSQVLETFAAWLRPLHARLYELKGWGATAIEQCRLGWESQNPFHPDARIVIPNYGPDGRMVGYVRYKPGGDPKSLAVGPRELYPAPETLPASDYVWLVEGEPDRVSAVELGLNAVAVPGIGKWAPDWAARFAGRRVVVCMDCDESCCEEARQGGGRDPEGSTQCMGCGNPKRRMYGGRDHAWKILAHMAEVGVEAVSVDLFPARTDGYDLGDALTAASHAGRVDTLRRYLIDLEGRAWQRSAAA